MITLRGVDGQRLAGALSASQEPLPRAALDGGVLDQLLTGGFLVAEGFDELAEVRATYWRARGETPMVLTITTTMECNLGCYYCYESRRPDDLQPAHVSAIVASARSKLITRTNRSLHVDWYGGEPLLNIGFLEEASTALQEMCGDIGASYVASVISNGTEWPSDVGRFVRDHQIRQVQISFDGLQANHDKRRRYRKAFRGAGESSFLRTVDTVDRLVRCVQVDVRLNIDRKNSGDVLPFIEFARRRGWFSGPFPAVFQPARISAYSARSAFLRSSELTMEEFDSIRSLVRSACDQLALVEESEVPDGYPLPKSSVCAALAPQSEVIGADGLSYRCGLQVGETLRAVGVVVETGSRALGSEFVDASWWRTFDPTQLPTCSQCSFLPICFGGCPKKHLDGDRHAIQEQGRYWRANLARLIAKKVGLTVDQSFAFGERDQFRRPPPASESLSPG